jgi:phenylalanyl-tRNA synthetase alpha chain
MTSEEKAQTMDPRVLAVSQEVAALADAALEQIGSAATSEDLEKLRVTYLGKQSRIVLLSKELGKVPAELRPAFGEAVNAGKKRLQEALAERKSSMGTVVPRSKNAIDVTLPGIRKGAGRRHPLMQTMEAVKTVLQGMGFRYDDYPEVETEYHNFDSLNTPKWHPSRDMHDSFYTKTGGVVRTHTTAFQVRAMRDQKTPPIRAMTSGRCYRRDEIDATHFPIFNQLDVIAIDQAISFADLKWTLDRLIRALLGQDVKLQFRPSYFPFTTPSAEVDVFYRGRWMELLGSGMIRPEVLRNGELDPDRYQGFAFGMGIDRLTMARYGIDDIRLLYANEESFLSQF